MQSPKIDINSIALRTAALTLLSVASGCISSQPPQAATPSAASPVATRLASVASSPSPQINLLLERAEDKAISAKNIARSAKSKQDWNLVINRWQQAIALVQTVPSSHPKKALAQQKLADYQRQLADAKQQMVNLSKPPVANASKPTNPNRLPVSASPKVALAQHLKQTGAKMYGTFWCSACRWQERQFGTQAYDLIKSMQIECDPRGKNAQVDLCRQAKVAAYPSWEINGQLYRGGRYLNQLADLSGYQGSRNFDL